MPQTKEQRQASKKKYREANKEKIAAYNKQYREANKESLAAKQKIYMKNNKELLNSKAKKWSNENPEKRKKISTISKWKFLGLVCEDYDSLYCHYLNAEYCDECCCMFGKKGDGNGTFKCMDHSHETGKFRNFLCCACNLRRR